MVTRNPPAMLELEDYVTAVMGGHNYLGVVGDDEHFNGYHLAGDEVPRDDYSTEQSRDRTGIKFGEYASAIDIGVEWPDCRLWFTWLLERIQAGDFPDLVEVVGSVDGKTDVYCYFTQGQGWYIGPHNGSHLTHFHLGFFRDAVFRSQLGIFTRWRTKVTASPRPSPLPPMPLPVPVDVLRPKPRFSEPRFWPALIAAGGLAWIIKRRKEAGL